MSDNNNAENNHKNLPLAIRGLQNVGAVLRNASETALHRTYNHVAKGEALDGSTRYTADLINNAKRRFEILAKVSKKVSREEVKDLESLIANDPELRKKFEEISEDETKKKNLEFFAPLNKQMEEAEEGKMLLDEQNPNRLFGRIFTSLVLSGALDVLDILGDILDHFGGDFAKSVGEVLRDPNVMGGFADVNQDLGVDKLLEKASNMPILNDVNQFVVDSVGSDYLSPFSSLARDFMGTEIAKFAFGTLVLANFINDEALLYFAGKDFEKSYGKTLRELAPNPLSEKICKNVDTISAQIANRTGENICDICDISSYLEADKSKKSPTQENFVFGSGENKTEVPFHELTSQHLKDIDLKDPNNAEKFKKLAQEAKMWLGKENAVIAKENKNKKAEILRRLIEKNKDRYKDQDPDRNLESDVGKDLVGEKLDEGIKKIYNKYLVKDIRDKILEGIRSCEAPNKQVDENKDKKVPADVVGSADLPSANPGQPLSSTALRGSINHGLGGGGARVV